MMDKANKADDVLEVIEEQIDEIEAHENGEESGPEHTSNRGLVSGARESIIPLSQNEIIQKG